MKATPEVVGTDEVRRQIRRMQDAVSKTSATSDLKGIHADAAKLVQADAERITPVRSGKLKNTLRSTGTVKAGVVRAGFSKVPYAGPIHFGWPKRNIRPNPFLYKAADQRANEVLELFDQRVNALIRKFDLD